MKFIDLQGFQFAKSNFICKEIAIFDDETKEIVHKIVKSPLPFECLSKDFQMQVRWLTENLHGLEWGLEPFQLPYEELSAFISRYVTFDDEIYIKGLEKKNWLCKILSHRYDLNYVDVLTKNCPNFKELKKTYHADYCCEHVGKTNGVVCALQNVNVLYMWYRSKMEEKHDSRCNKYNDNQ